MQESRKKRPRVCCKIINRDLENAFPAWYNDLDRNRQDVIINMVYNLGLQGFRKFKKMIHCLEIKDYTGATMEMLQSKWAKQVGKRADRLAKIMKPSPMREGAYK